MKLGVAVPECKEDHSLLQDHRPRRAIYEALNDVADELENLKAACQA